MIGPTRFAARASFRQLSTFGRNARARSLMREMDELMSKWDVFVSPAPGSASLLITNLTGHPAVCVPCGFPKGLPQSIMFTGGLYDEGAPLRVALAYERATNGTRCIRRWIGREKLKRRSLLNYRNGSFVICHLSFSFRIRSLDRHRGSLAFISHDK